MQTICIATIKYQSKLCLSRSFVILFEINLENYLHSLRNIKVNFAYLVRLLYFCTTKIILYSWLR